MVKRIPKSTSAARRDLRRALQRAAGLDSGLQLVLDDLGYPEPRTRDPGFATLLRIIVSQQLSTRVAAVIWQRLEGLCRGAVTHRKILARNTAQLRECGLSQQKVEYAQGLARGIREKTIDLVAIGRLDGDGAIAELVKVRGVGQWSAEIYVMFALAHGDIFPAGDLALQVAVQRYMGLAERPNAKQTATLATRWSPHRSSVALLMWKYYGATTLG